MLDAIEAVLEALSPSDESLSSSLLPSFYGTAIVSQALPRAKFPPSPVTLSMQVVAKAILPTKVIRPANKNRNNKKGEGAAALSGIERERGTSPRRRAAVGRSSAVAGAVGSPVLPREE